MDTYQKKRKMTRNEMLRRKFIQQRIIGALMIAIMIAFFAVIGNSGEDASAGLLIGFMGVWLIVSRHILIL